jgi:hypothetical protein
LAKVCVFCGKKPREKTKEHIIPHWLIKLTGKPNRKAFIGFVKNLETGFTRREFSFDQFTFPACNVCNNKYAKLERDVKPIITKILSNTSVFAEEISTFLDWLDKVRVGLWLGMNQLDKNYADVDPNFHIETRISQFDRILITEKSDGKENKLNFGGVDTFSFALTPSAFVLIINNYYFTNISYMFLISRRLGFPYPKTLFIQPDDERIEADFVLGRERVMLPVLRKQIKEKGTIIYQPIYRGGLIEGDVTGYDSEYVRQHSIDHNHGVGNIYLDEGRQLKESTLGDLLNITPNYIHNDRELFIKCAIHIREWQNWLVQLLPSDHKLSQDQKQYVKSRFKTGVKINDIFINHHKSLL